MKSSLIRSISAVLAMAALSVSSGRAATIDELVAGLRVEVDKAMEEAKSSRNGSSSSALEADRLMSRLETAFAKESYNEIDSILSQLAVTRLSTAAKEGISQLQREIPKAADERHKAFISQVAATIEKAGKACLAAKSESDLDSIVADLGVLKKQGTDSGGGYNEGRQRLNTRLDGAIRFVNRWQDYLLHGARGYETSARGILRELADPNGNSYYPVLTRAQVVERLGKDQEMTVDEVIRGVKSLDDVPRAIAELTRLTRENGSRGTFGYDYSSPLNELNQIARAHAAFKAGNYGSALMTSAQWEGSSGLRSPESMRLKTLLLLEVLPRYLELSDNPQPKPDENPSDFLLRMAGEGAAKKDWARVARALDAYRLTAFLQRQPPSWISADLEACQQFVAGQNLERARRYVPAILAYQRAAKGSGRFSPQQDAADRLAVLQKEQPAAFADADKEPQVRELLDAVRSAGPQRGGMLLEQY